MSDKSQFSQIEEEMLDLWDKEKTFEDSLSQRKEKKRFSFYDGPPFASGEPHYGHLEQTAVKDSVVRYKTMQGFFVPRRTGYDTHGLPIEYLVEKDLGLKSKQDILKFGIDKFNNACREIVFRHREDFEAMYRRMGRWAKPEEAYATLDDNYIESVWWAFSELYKKDLIYQGYKSVAYCPRCATPLSNFEVNDGYKDDVSDPSLYVKFKLKDKDEYLLAWTTTPWSLPGNAALAVHPQETYITIEVREESGKKERLILAEKRKAIIDGKIKVLSKTSGSKLAGQQYNPPVKLPAEQLKDAKKLYEIIESKEVSTEDGTGILHVAPAYGELDLGLSEQVGLPVLHVVDENGLMKEDSGLPEVTGQFFKKADDGIIADLTKRDLVYAVDSSFTHTYPFCWRCETPLLYYAINTWFVKVTAIQDELLKNGKETSWVPLHVKNGRFLNWLEGARDWAISRNRFWGAPLPIWQTADGETIVISSLDELRKKAINPDKIDDLHRPGIDEVVIKTDSGKEAHRVSEVFDCWFESGSMPYAQDHYPFENKAEFDQSYPADFIVEAIEQVHLWFYTLHVLATALFNKPAYKHVIADGLILAADGKKLSKRLRNYPPINELVDKYGADTTRMFILSSPLMMGKDTRMSDQAFRDIYRNVFMTLFNSYKFFKTYSDIDKWQPPNQLSQPKSNNILDKWILTRLNSTIQEVTRQADKYHLSRATRPIMELIDDLSNWYVRRSRRRFWKSEDDNDKQTAYATLHFVLIRITQLLAPFSPFLADKIYRDLRSSQMPKSVHLTDWPSAEKYDDQLITEMQQVRATIVEGLSQRAIAGVKVRQPLNKITIPKLPEEYKQVIAEELNVKEINWGKVNSKAVLDTTLTDQLKIEGLMRELVRYVQSARKKAELNVEDRIHLGIETDSSQLRKALDEYKNEIMQETLAKDLNKSKEYSYTEEVKIEGEPALVKINKTA